MNRSIGNLLPQKQGISGAYNYTYIPNGSTRGGGISGALGALSNNNGSLSLGSLIANNYFFFSSWEIDFWGKYRRQIESDKESYLAAVASYDDALVSLIGEVAQHYLIIRTDEEQIRIINENIKLQQEKENHYYY